MKKLSSKQKETQIRISLNRHKKFLRRVKRKKEAAKKLEQEESGFPVRKSPAQELLNQFNSPAQEVARLSSIFPAIKITSKKGRIDLKAPQIMQLDKNNDEVMQFFHCLRVIIKANLQGIKRIAVDFSTIEKLSPLCAMLLATEMHRWQLIRNQKLLVIDSELWRPEIRRLLVDIGIFKIVEVANPCYHDLEAIEPEERFISLRTGQLVDMEIAVKEIENEVIKVSTLLNSSPVLFGGMEEAITNVLQWAYKGCDEEKIGTQLINRWWFLASYNETTKRIKMMIYDHGLGIPNTLPASKWTEQLKKWLDDNGIKEYADHNIIEAAMKFPRSASGKPYRAKGLRKMRELLGKFHRSTLYIYSGKGEYRVDQDNVEVVKPHKYPINGTLIVWEIHMNDGASYAN